MRMPEVRENRTETKPVVQKNMGGVWLWPERQMIGPFNVFMNAFGRDFRLKVPN